MSSFFARLFRGQAQNRMDQFIIKFAAINLLRVLSISKDQCSISETVATKMNLKKSQNPKISGY
jgi:hypothetical protein